MAGAFSAFDDSWGENARLAWDTLALGVTQGIPSMFIHVMDHRLLEEVAGHAPGDYKKDPETVYLDFQLAAGTCACDQWIPGNPLTMSDQGLEPSTQRGTTTGAKEIVLDGMAIDSPEAVVEHMERFVFPRWKKEAAETDPTDEAEVVRRIEHEVRTQKLFGSNMLKVPYDFQDFPRFLYFNYGYENYFTAYALYPEVMERSFALQADRAIQNNRLLARAILEGGLPRMVRLDHDMTDSRGPLVNIRSLEDIWFPHFARAIRPFLDAGIRLLWHCDGNVTEMVPRLIEAGVGGFQGFQYETGVDYEALCRMTDRDGGPLMIWAGVSVTRTLPFGTKEDVAKELQWLVANGPRVGLFLGTSSSVTPGTKRENIKTLLEGLRYWREHGRD